MDDRPPVCRWCCERHASQWCPMVKALEFDPISGSVTRVEFLTDADYQHTRQHPKTETDAGDHYPRLGPGWKPKA